jgi:hypothetical protein
MNGWDAALRRPPDSAAVSSAKALRFSLAWGGAPGTGVCERASAEKRGSFRRLCMIESERAP